MAFPAPYYGNGAPASSVSQNRARQTATFQLVPYRLERSAVTLDAVARSARPRRPAGSLDCGYVDFDRYRLLQQLDRYD